MKVVVGWEFSCVIGCRWSQFTALAKQYGGVVTERGDAEDEKFIGRTTLVDSGKIAEFSSALLEAGFGPVIRKQVEILSK